MRARALAVACLLALGPVTPGHAVPETVAGGDCHLTAVPDPTAEKVTYTTLLLAGPIVLRDAATGMPARGTLSCRIQVSQSTHDGITRGITSAHDIGVFAPAGVTSFTAPSGAPIYACMEFVEDDSGNTYYYDGQSGAWTDSPDAPCGLAGVVVGIALHTIGCTLRPFVPCTVDPTIPAKGD